MLKSDILTTSNFQLIEPEAIKIEFNEIPINLSIYTIAKVLTRILLYEIGE